MASTRRLAKVPHPMRSAESDSPWITVQDAADYIGVSVDTIYLACAEKRLRHAKIGRHTIRLRRAWVDEWLETAAAS